MLICLIFIYFLDKSIQTFLILDISRNACRIVFELRGYTENVFNENIVWKAMKEKQDIELKINFAITLYHNTLEMMCSSKK